MRVGKRGTYDFPVDLFVETCCSCGMVFAMPKDWKDRLVRKNGTFYCPRGHEQWYSGKTEAQKERERADRLARDADYQRQERRAAERRELTAKQQHGKTKAKLRRIEAGACPHCSETFPNIARHMQDMHGAEQHEAVS